MKTFLLYSLILQVFAIDYLKLIEENFDESITPCDNLYRFVCPINGSVLTEVMTQEFEKELENIEIPEKYIDMKEQLELLIEETSFETPEEEDLFVMRMVEPLEQLCLNNRDEYARVLKGLDSLGPQQSFATFLLFNDCHDAALTLKVPIYNEFLTTYSSESFFIILKTIDSFKLFQWLEDNRDVYQRLKSTVTIIKSFASQLILTTPWIQNRNYTKLYEEVWNQMYLSDNLDDKYTNEQYLQEFSTKVQECRESLNASFLTPICYNRAIHGLVHKPRLMGTIYNAGNGHPYMDISNGFIYFAAIDLPPAFYLGSVAHVLAHEVGHSYIVSSRGDSNLPYFPNETRSCIQNQFTKSCEFFAEEECETSDNQFDENGADVFAYGMMYEILKFAYGENINDLVKGTTKNITNAQLFFLSTPITLCSNSPTTSVSWDSHHAEVVRVNSVAAQNLDFEDYFNCPKNSKMAESKTEKCYVLGENAAITK